MQPALPGVFPYKRGDRVRVTATHHEGPFTSTFIKDEPRLVDGRWVAGVVGGGMVPVERISRPEA